MYNAVRDNGKNNRRSERDSGEIKGFGGSYCYQGRRAKCSTDCIWESSVRGRSAVDGCFYEEDRGEHKGESKGSDLCLGYGYFCGVSAQR